MAYLLSTIVLLELVSLMLFGELVAIVLRKTPFCVSSFLSNADILQALQTWLIVQFYIRTVTRFVNEVNTSLSNWLHTQPF